MERVELHLHTTMSTMDGVSTIGDYIKEAVDRNMCAIAITDHASVQAFPDAYKLMIHNRLGLFFKLIYGNEIYLVDDVLDAEKSYKGHTMHASVLVLDKIGLKNLYKLVSLANTEYFYKVPRTPKSVLEKYREGLLIGAGCDCGELYLAIINGRSDEELLKIASFYDYLEVVPTTNFRYYIDSGYVNNDEELININKKIIDIGDKAGKKVVAVSDAHYVREDDAIRRKILMSYKGFVDYSKQPDLSMKTTEEMLDEFKYLGCEKAYEIVVDNPNIIAEKASEFISPIDTETCYKADIRELVDLTYEKLNEKYGKNVPQEFLDRIDIELSKIGKNNTSIYNILLSSKLANKSKNLGWTVGNRGSVASSFVAYLLGITEVNPMEAHYHCPKCHYTEFHKEYNCGVDMEDKYCICGAKMNKDGYTIPCETFFGIDGTRDIDIDFNFPPQYQKDAMNDLSEFANGDVIRCGTLGTIATKTAYKMIDEYSKKENIEFDESQKAEMANKLSRVKRVTGMHPGGIYIIPDGKAVLDYTPIQHPADFTECGIITTHFDYYCLYDLLKVDILAHDMHSMIKHLEELTKVRFDEVPFGDYETMQLFKGQKTVGVPEFGTTYVRENFLSRINVDSFDDLIRISGLSHGTNVWNENIESDIIKRDIELSDVISTRDDITLYLLRKGFEREEAFMISERVRKGKGLTEENVEDMYRNGIPLWYIENCNRIKYLFPRAHATSYVLFAYKIAYYKAHYPLEFYCAYFSTYADDFDAELLVNNSKTLSESINKARINENQWGMRLKLEMMEVCQEMYESGYKFISDTINRSKFDSFFIEDGMLRPKIRM